LRKEGVKVDKEQKCGGRKQVCLNSINKLIFVIDKCCAFFEVKI
jgi:hypothetical protein